MRIPTDAEIRALHSEYAPTLEAFGLVHTHCAIVCGIAEQLLSRSGTGADPALVRAGSLLHDIGVYRLYGASGALDHSQYVRHGVLGRDLLADLGFPAALCRFCSCHTGVGLNRADVRAQHLPIPEEDYLAETAAEELVMFADKFHTKSDPPVLVSTTTAAARLQRFGAAKVLRFETLLEKLGEPDLRPFQDAYGHAVV